MWKKLIDWWNKPKYYITEQVVYYDQEYTFYNVFRSGLLFDDFIGNYSSERQAKHVVEVLTNS